MSDLIANHEIYNSVRRASFDISMMYPLAAGKMPEDLYIKVFTLYEMLRVADIIEDNKPHNKEELLRTHSKSLYEERINSDIDRFITTNASNNQEKGAAKHYTMFFDIFTKLPDKTKEIIASTNNAMIPGMINESYNNIQTWNQQSEYAGYVAGEVGIGLTRLFAEHIIMNNIESMLYKGYLQGIALQKIHMLKDLRADISEGKNYIPEELLKYHNLKREDLFTVHKIDKDELFQNPNSEKLKRQYNIIRDIASNAQNFLTTGLEYVLDIPLYEKHDTKYSYAKGIRIFTSSLLLVAQEISYNIYNKPELTEDKYSPKSLLIKYGALVPLIWKDDKKITSIFKSKTIEK